MGKYNYSPETESKIDELCRNCAVNIILSYPTADLTKVEAFLEKSMHFIKDNFSKLGAQEFIFLLDCEDDSNATKIDAAHILKELSAYNNTFTINDNLTILNAERIENIDIVSIAKASIEKDLVTILVHNGIEISIFVKGVPIEQRSLNHPSALPVLNKRFNRSAIDYKVSLIDFYKEKVRPNLTNHWQNTSKRILKGGKTEDIFQIGLAQWLNDNLTAKRINMKVKKLSADETDIEIIRHGGETYLLELKWLGQNEKSMYGLTKLTSAFDQVQNYLDVDNDVLEATLVVFDGRKLEDFEKLQCVEEETSNWKEIRECETKTLPFRAKAFVFHLVSESASKRKSA